MEVLLKDNGQKQDAAAAEPDSVDFSDFINHRANRHEAAEFNLAEPPIAEELARPSFESTAPKPPDPPVLSYDTGMVTDSPHGEMIDLGMSEALPPFKAIEEL